MVPTEPLLRLQRPKSSMVWLWRIHFLSIRINGFAFFEESIELSRRFRALKVWLSLRYHGLHSFRAAIQQDLDHAQRLGRAIEDSASLELLGPVELSAVCFRHLLDKDASEESAIASIWPYSNALLRVGGCIFRTQN